MPERAMICPACSKELESRSIDDGKIIIYSCSFCASNWYNASILDFDCTLDGSSETQFTCPNCFNKLLSGSWQSVPMRRCPRCDGIWLEQAQVANLRRILGRDGFLKPAAVQNESKSSTPLRGNLTRTPDNRPNKAKPMTLFRFFLIALVASLVISALSAVAVVLGGRMGWMEGRILLSTAAIATYSLMAMCCSTIYDPKKPLSVATIGLSFCGLGLLFALLTNWEVIKPGMGDLFKARFALLSLSMAFATVSLMLKIVAKATMVDLCRKATIGIISVNTALVNWLIFIDFKDVPAEFWKVIWSLAIFGVLGIILTPILNKFSAPE